MAMACSTDEAPASPVTPGSSSGTTGDVESTTLEAETTTAPPSPDSSGTTDEPGTTPTCGDAVVSEGEACDDGTNDGRYGGCEPGCGALGPRCGDGIVDPEGYETCDAGEANGTVACNRWCKISGSRLAELEGPLSYTSESHLIVRTDSGRIFVVAMSPRTLWEFTIHEDGSLETVSKLNFQQLLDGNVLPSSVVSFVSADGDDALAIAGSKSNMHELYVFDVGAPGEFSVGAPWQFLTDVPNDGTTDLLSVGASHWLIGDAHSGGPNDVQGRWIHRFPSLDILSPATSSMIWYGSSERPRPRGFVDPETGYVAMFQGRVGFVADHMRLSVHEPTSAEEVFFDFDFEHEAPVVICARPEGGMLVLARTTVGAGQTVALGYQVDPDGSLVGDGEVVLDLGAGMYLEHCATGRDSILLTGQVDGRSIAVAVEDVFGPQPTIAWQHVDLSVGLRVAETAGEALYHDGRYFVTLGYQAGVVVFAE